MRFLQSYGVARVRNAGEIKQTHKDETYVETVVEFEDRKSREGKIHSQRLVFRSFHAEDVARAPMIQPGCVIVFEGNTDAVVTMRDGKAYANPRVTGRIMQIVEVTT